MLVRTFLGEKKGSSPRGAGIPKSHRGNLLYRFDEIIQTSLFGPTKPRGDKKNPKEFLSPPKGKKEKGTSWSPGPPGNAIKAPDFPLEG